MSFDNVCNPTKRPSELYLIQCFVCKSVLFAPVRYHAKLNLQNGELIDLRWCIHRM